MIARLGNETEASLYTDYGTFYVRKDETSGDYVKILQALDSRCTIRITGIDDGSMSVSLTDLADGDCTNIYYFNDIPVAEGEVFTLDLNIKRLVSESGSYDLGNNVFSVITDMSISETECTLALGSSKQLSVESKPANSGIEYDIAWRSTDDTVVSVDENGLITTLSEGTADIIAYETNGTWAAQCSVTVINPVTKVTVSDKLLSILIYEKATVIKTVYQEDAAIQTVTWSSSNEAVATVDQNGVVTGITPGTAVITVTTVDGGFTDTCTVTVLEPTVTKIEIMSMPYTTSFRYKAALDASGLTLNVFYSDGSTQTASEGFTCTPTTLLSTVRQKITGTYEDQTTSYDVTVKYTWWQWLIKILLFGWIWY